ncbi:MAG: hypothetical protein JRH20_10150 [Deltaproteobacteria bacterium]|nr:hypothetical protein [Deltaproteobacteria bacterium]
MGLDGISKGEGLFFLNLGHLGLQGFGRRLHSREGWAPFQPTDLTPQLTNLEVKLLGVGFVPAATKLGFEELLLVLCLTLVEPHDLAQKLLVSRIEIVGHPLHLGELAHHDELLMF